MTLLLALGLSQAQERPVFINDAADHFTIDIQDNVYLWKESTLKKYNADGTLDCRYSNPAYGTITAVDAKIPSKILVFFQESGMLVLLDNKLSPIGNNLNLLENNLFFITLAALSSTQQLTLYDNNEQTLYLTDFYSNILQRTQCDFATDFHPTEIAINLDKEMVLTDPKSGLFFFDPFGSFVKRVALTDVSSVNYWGNDIYYLKDSAVYRYDLRALDNTLLIDGLNDAKAFARSNKYIYYLDHSGKLFRHLIKP